MIKISIVNKSVTYSDEELRVLANALQIQVSRDFFPIWGTNALIYYTPKGFNPSADHWVVGIFDQSDASDALGYHDVTPTGMPLGKAFLGPTLAQGSQISITVSHEILEMLGDPDINLCAEVDDKQGRPSKFYAYEVCDAPEDDQFGYTIDTDGQSVLVSDFVTPAWFEGFRTTGPFDFRKKISKPFELLPGGYIGFLDLGNLQAGWQQQFARAVSLDVKAAAKAFALARPRPGSRRARRSLPREHWITSTYKPNDNAALAAFKPSIVLETFLKEENSH